MKNCCFSNSDYIGLLNFNLLSFFILQEIVHHILSRLKFDPLLVGDRRQNGITEISKSLIGNTSLSRLSG